MKCKTTLNRRHWIRRLGVVMGAVLIAVIMIPSLEVFAQSNRDVMKAIRDSETRMKKYLKPQLLEMKAEIKKLNDRVNSLGSGAPQRSQNQRPSSGNPGRAIAELKTKLEALDTRFRKATVPVIFTARRLGLSNAGCQWSYPYPPESDRVRRCAKNFKSQCTVRGLSAARTSLLGAGQSKGNNVMFYPLKELTCEARLTR